MPRKKKQVKEQQEEPKVESSIDESLAPEETAIPEDEPEEEPKEEPKKKAEPKTTKQEAEEPKADGHYVDGLFIRKKPQPEPKPKPAPPTFEQAVKKTGEQWEGGKMIRIVDDEDHLLCKYNPSTKAIEIRVPVGRSSDKGKMFSISTDVLRNAGATNFISENPVFELRAERMDGQAK